MFSDYKQFASYKMNDYELEAAELDFANKAAVVKVSLGFINC
jgi:hypothetical protein